MSSKSMFKVVILGDPSVGKTSLRKRFFGKGFTTSYLPTMGCDFAVLNISRGQHEVEFQLWDLAGQPSFELLIPRFIANSSGALFVFDLKRRDTFVNLSKWLKKFKEINEEDLKNKPLYIVGNKADLEDHVISKEEMDQYREYIQNKLEMNEANVRTFLTSAKTGENVQEMFNGMIDLLLEETLSDK